MMNRAYFNPVRGGDCRNGCRPGNEPMAAGRHRQSGFTLIELMIVIAIIGILASIALPAYKTYTDRSHFTEVVLAVGSVKTSVDACFQTKGSLSECNTSAKLGLDLAGVTAGEYVSSVSIDNATVAIEGTGTADVGSDTYILTPTDGGNGTLTWAQSGTCNANGTC